MLFWKIILKNFFKFTGKNCDGILFSRDVDLNAEYFYKQKTLTEVFSWVLMIHFQHIKLYIHVCMSKVFKQKRQLVCNLKLHVLTLQQSLAKWVKCWNLQYHGIFCIIWCHVKVFTKCFRGKSVSSNLVSYRERGAGQIPENSNFVRSKRYSPCLMRNWK